ncbi:MAG: CDP-diacylglycerol--serine O-phosphatidyltransferase [Alphaproteobacteria bacterium 62-8]|jgi:CDP-diacylglycerol--serine O-phosphatidyltransferase|nr:MAG: CDP-diacylglycerol--serine O-phosphatidyltransferase [Alphaproteobacteria bacterium 62-8]
MVMERFEDLSMAKLAPSALTLLGLASGATAIRFAMEANFKLAVAAVVAAMLFDMLDGRVARKLGADTRFGAQLDSLADLVSFGVAPAVIAYTWSLSRMGEGGWVAAVIFCICAAIRLARFNIQAARDEGATEANPYFTGLPTPAAACVMLLPLLISFQFDHGDFQNPLFACALVAATSILMVSRLPTPSIKYMHVQRQHRFLIALLVACIAGLMVMWPWATLTIGLIAYLATIPIGILAAGDLREASGPRT